jgi:hypothetical protein
MVAQTLAGSRKKDSKRPRHDQAGNGGYPLRQLHGFWRVTRFFDAAGLQTSSPDGYQLLVVGVPFPTETIHPNAEGVDWNWRIDRFVMSHFKREFERALARWGPRQTPSQERRLRTDGLEVLREGDHLYSVNATRASLPNGQVVKGNFLSTGSHWDRLRDLVAAREELLDSGLSVPLMKLIRAELPGISPLLVRVR